MSLHFYEEEEGFEKGESINKYWDIFLEYTIETPTLSDALKQMFFSAGADKNEVDELILDILSKSEQKIDSNFKEIKKKYPDISRDEAIIISSYTCESKIQIYSPYKLLNTALSSKNRKKGIENISKYLYILLNSLRKLKRFYPNSEIKYLYRCIGAKVNLKENPKDKNFIPYANGNIKTFWAFTSASPDAEMTYRFLGKKEKMNSGTRFTLTGNVWGYDISLFNIFDENEILLEPERKFLIDEVKPEVNEIIDIRCEVLDTPLVLYDSSDPETITLRYKIDPSNNDTIKTRIFGKKFVENQSSSFLFWSSSKLKIFYEDNEYKFSQYFEFKNIKRKKFLEIRLKGINYIKDMSHMFSDCESLITLPNITKWDTKEISDMSHMFKGCKSLKFLPDISQWSTDNVVSVASMFENCEALQYLPDISKWNTSKVTNISSIFGGCKSLKSLPDISKWDISHVTQMNFIFSKCESIQTLPDISKWNTSKCTDMSGIFVNCSSLLSLPDISKWDISKNTNLDSIFSHCHLLKSLPGISIWDTSEVTNMNCIFEECYNLLSLPDITKWNTSKVTTMNGLFNTISSLTNLPDISKWDTSKVTDMSCMFCCCGKLKSLPDISKWKISTVKNIHHMFYSCKGLLFLPDISDWETNNIKDMNHAFCHCVSLKSLFQIGISTKLRNLGECLEGANH